MRSQLKVLAVCDEVDSRLYGTSVCARPKPDLILGCGDLPAYYLDFLVSQLDAPLYAVHGNHDAPPATEQGMQFANCGANWIGGRLVKVKGLLLAGFDGSLRYNEGAYQSSQLQMHAAVRSLAPWLWLNRLRYGRALDVLVTHAPPLGVHDDRDICHTGFQAYRWLLDTFRPRYHVHGHVHRYDRRMPAVTRVGSTDVVNVYPFRELVLEAPTSP
jgi:uncharacterized protein